MPHRRTEAEPSTRGLRQRPSSSLPSGIGFCLLPALTPADCCAWVGPPGRERTPCLSFLQGLQMSDGNLSFRKKLIFGEQLKCFQRLAPTRLRCSHQYSLIQAIFIEGLLCARHWRCARDTTMSKTRGGSSGRPPSTKEPCSCVQSRLAGERGARVELGEACRGAACSTARRGFPEAVKWSTAHRMGRSYSG